MAYRFDWGFSELIRVRQGISPRAEFLIVNWFWRRRNNFARRRIELGRSSVHPRRRMSLLRVFLFLPFNRTVSHINQIEYLAGVLCAVIWSRRNPPLIMRGIPDNTCPDVWISEGTSRRGAGLVRTRTPHLWVIGRNFRPFSFYSRLGRNFSAYSPMEDGLEIAECGAD